LSLTSGTLTIVYMGTACLLGLDHQRRELLGFIGVEVGASTFQEYLLPILAASRPTRWDRSCCRVFRVARRCAPPMRNLRFKEIVLAALRREPCLAGIRTLPDAETRKGAPGVALAGRERVGTEFLEAAREVW